MRPLLVAAAAAVLAIGAAHKGDPNEGPPDTGVPGVDLMNAAASGNIEKVEALLKAGEVTVGHTNEFGETPLHVAALSKRWKMLQFLLKHGANASAVTDGEYEGHTTRVRRSVLEWWVVHCEVAPVQFLADAGADLAYEDEEGKTVLDRARASGKRCEVVVDFIERRLRGDDNEAGGAQDAGDREDL